MTIEKIDKKEYEAKRVNDPKGKELEPWKNKSLKTSVNLMSMLEAFGKKLYDSKISALRETVVNHISHGAWAAMKKGESAHVEIWFDEEKRTIVIRDFNGMGIPFHDMEVNCTELGGSGNDDRSLPGQHGYGFFAWLAIANFCTVETWSRITDEHYCYVGREGKIWEPSDEKTLDSYGTKTTMVVDEDVNYRDLEENCHQFIEYFPVKTIIHTSSGDDIDYGNKIYGDKFEKPLTLENDNMLVVIEQTREAPDTWRNRSYGGAEDQEFFINNVPINVNSDLENAVYQCFRFKCNIKNESFVIPPIQRDKLNKDDASKVVGLIEKMVCDELVKHECNTIEDFLSIDDKWLWQKDKTIRQAFVKSTEEFYGMMDRRLGYSPCDPEAICNKPKTKNKGESLEFGNILQRFDNIFLENQNGRKDRLIIGNNLPRSACINSVRRGSNDDDAFWSFIFKTFSDVKEVIKSNKYKIKKGEVSQSISVYCRSQTDGKTTIDIDSIKKSDLLFNIPLGDKSRQSWNAAFDTGACDMFRESVSRQVKIIGTSEIEVHAENRFPLNISYSRKFAEKLHDEGNILTLSDILEKLQTITTLVTTMEPENEWKEPQVIEMSLFDAIPFMQWQNYKTEQMYEEHNTSKNKWGHDNDFNSFKYLESIDNPVSFNAFHVPRLDDRMWVRVSLAIWHKYIQWCIGLDSERHVQKPTGNSERVDFTSMHFKDSDIPDVRDVTLRTWVSTLDYTELGSDFKEWIDWDYVLRDMAKELGEDSVRPEYYLQHNWVRLQLDSDDNSSRSSYQILTSNAMNSLKWGSSYVRKVDPEDDDYYTINSLYTTNDPELNSVRVYDIMKSSMNNVHPRLHNMFIRMFSNDTDHEYMMDGNQWKGNESEMKPGSAYYLSPKAQFDKGWWRADQVANGAGYKEDINKLNRLVCSISEFIYASTKEKLDWSDHRLLRVFGLGHGYDAFNDLETNGKITRVDNTQHLQWIGKFSYMDISPEDIWNKAKICFPVTVNNLQERSDILELDGESNPLYTDMWKTCRMFESASEVKKTTDVIQPDNIVAGENKKHSFIISKLREQNPEFFSKDALICDIKEVVWRSDVELFNLTYFQKNKLAYLERLATVDMLIEYRNAEKFSIIKESMSTYTDTQYTVNETIDSISIEASPDFNWGMFLMEKRDTIQTTEPEDVLIKESTLTIRFKLPKISKVPVLLNYK